MAGEMGGSAFGSAKNASLLWLPKKIVPYTITPQLGECRNNAVDLSEFPQLGVLAAQEDYCLVSHFEVVLVCFLCKKFLVTKHEAMKLDKTSKHLP